MYTILKENKTEIEVMKSKFISYVIHIENLAEFNLFLKKLKNEHQKARHICYAYFFKNEKKYSDDGEPSGTAGRPILNLIEQNDLSDVAIFVVRYFGGTLLGSGRLLRTYVESAKRVIDESKKVEIKEMLLYKVSIDYEGYSIFKNYLKIKQFDTLSTSFNDTIIIEFYTPLEYKEDLNSLFYGNIKSIEFKKVNRLMEEN